ncbi:hypothetical protein ACFQ15_17665 [Sphingomonas hankookensis]|uniref:hypothetical protein n=1 Tax=Sphingomonas hankookensis TaxID=563996 RepID=UPI001F565976|nr:hypothetical protein [Sphingomonas hankookensis]
MIGTWLLLLSQPGVSAATPPDEIVVTGHRAVDALAECLARNCPPAEDIEASLQASVEQFTVGQYVAARRTLQKSIVRNDRYSKRFPEAFSSLYATLATVAEHEGKPALWQDSSRNSMRVLRRERGVGDPATLIEWLSYADTLAAKREYKSAERTYGNVQRLARTGGHPEIAAGAMYRLAWLALAQRQLKKAERLVDDAVETAGSDSRSMIELREIVRARVAILRGDQGAVDAMAARLSRSAEQRPLLLFSEPMPTLGSFTRSESVGDGGISFVDVGYWIRPDGRTPDISALRSRRLSTFATPILKNIAQRRYAPLNVNAGHPGVYRIDRVTIRSPIIAVRPAKRGGPPTAHVIDLTETDAMRDAQKRRAEDALAGATGT